jgi:hypothetical protein
LSVQDLWMESAAIDLPFLLLGPSLLLVYLILHLPFVKSIGNVCWCGPLRHFQRVSIESRPKLLTPLQMVIKLVVHRSG